MLKYEQRGWPNFERAVCEMLSDFGHLLDLGGLQGRMDRIKDYAGVEDACGVMRRAFPPLPHEMAAKLNTVTFTNGSDRALVGKIYARTMEEVVGTAQKFNYAHRGWNPDDITKLCQHLLRRSP